MLVHHHAHVGCALNVRLAAQRVHAAAGHADVAEQQLHDAHGARVLGAIGVLRLAESVQNGAGLTGLGRLAVRFVDKLEDILVHAANVGNGFKGVAGVMLLELLVDAALVGERHVLFRVSERRRGEFRRTSLLDPGVSTVLGSVPLLFGSGLVVPAVRIIGLRLLVPAAEQARFGVEFVVGIENVGSVGIVEQILEVVVAHIARGKVVRQTGLDQVLDDVVIHATVERDIGAGTDGAPDVGLLGRTSVARIDNDPLRTLLVGLLKPQG